MDDELNARAGRNIGIESTILPYVQAGAGHIIPISMSGDTVIAEHTDQAARVMFAEGANTGLCGYVFNTGPAILDQAVKFLFVDELGNELPLNIDTPLANPSQPIELSVAVSDETFFCLAPGEKIIARLIPFRP